ncbi:hypothetical protein ACA910_020927 [Epithemia clementina (nom. ined.)]
MVEDVDHRGIRRIPSNETTTVHGDVFRVVTSSTTAITAAQGLDSSVNLSSRPCNLLRTKLLSSGDDPTNKTGLYNQELSWSSDDDESITDKSTRSKMMTGLSGQARSSCMEESNTHQGNMKNAMSSSFVTEGHSHGVGPSSSNMMGSPEEPHTAAHSRIMSMTVVIFDAVLACGSGSVCSPDYGNIATGDTLSQTSYGVDASLFDELQKIKRLGSWESSSATSVTCSISQDSNNSFNKQPNIEMLSNHHVLTRKTAFARRQQLKRKPRRPPRGVSFHHPIVSSLRQIPRPDPLKIPELFFSEQELRESRQNHRAISTKRWSDVHCYSTRDKDRVSLKTSTKIHKAHDTVTTPLEEPVATRAGNKKIARCLMHLGPRKRSTSVPKDQELLADSSDTEEGEYKEK